MIQTEIKGNLAGLEIGDNYPVRIMGVINLTGNSFYSASVRTTPEEIEQEVKKMKEEGADIIDVGARSTAPYRKYEIPTEVETRIIKKSVRQITKITDLPISVDTTRYDVAKAGLKEGASILNDVYGFRQRDAVQLAKLVASREVSLILTAHESRPAKIPNPVERVVYSLEEGLRIAETNGIESMKVTIDPGIGFFNDPEISNPDWNASVIANLEVLRTLERPLCVGVSRKSFIGHLTGNKPTEMRLNGSIAATAVAVHNGAHVIRTHDVSETLDAIRVSAAIREKRLIHDTR